MRMYQACHAAARRISKSGLVGGIHQLAGVLGCTPYNQEPIHTQRLGGRTLGPASLNQDPGHFGPWLT